MLDLRLLVCIIKLYSNSDHYLEIGAAGIQYFREYPERFIVIL